MLTIANGVAVQGGGIDNSGTLTVDDCTLLSNKAVGGRGDSTTPDAANGGGIANEAARHALVLDAQPAVGKTWRRPAPATTPSAAPS